jgi:hypothetical protein
MSGSSSSRDLAKARTLIGGTWHALLEAPDPYVQGSGVPLWRSEPIDAPWEVLSFPCHVVPLDLPMWWGRVPLSAWPGGAVRVQRHHAVEEGTLDSGYR